MIKFCIRAANPKMPNDKKPAQKKLKINSKLESKAIFVMWELYAKHTAWANKKDKYYALCA